MSKILKLLPSPPDDSEMDAAVFATAWMAQQSLEAEIKSDKDDKKLKTPEELRNTARWGLVE